MYEDQLQQLGLTQKEASLYELLVQRGPMLLPDLLKSVSYKRGDLYNILDSLETWGLVSAEKKKGSRKYFPTHPSKLHDIVLERERDIQKQKQSVEQVLSSLQSMYDIASDRPGVRVFAGKDGIIQGYEELLALGKDIDSIEDKGEMAKFIPEYATTTFPTERKKRKIFNRVIAPATNAINESSKAALCETHFLNEKAFPFGMDIKIAGETVYLVTLTHGTGGSKRSNAVGIRIDHPEVAKNFRVLFEYLWNRPTE